MQLVPSVGLDPAASCSQSRRTTDCAMTTYQTSSGLSGSEEVDPSWRWSRWGTYPSPATGCMVTALRWTGLTLPTAKAGGFSVR